MVLRTLVLLTLLWAATIAAADGGFAKRKHIERDPRIPYQRAIVSYQNGVETLIVETFLNGGKGDYTWIVPVPSHPIRVEKATAGTVRTAVELSTRRRSPGETKLDLLLLVLGGIGLLLLFTIGVRHSKGSITAKEVGNELLLLGVLAVTFFTIRGPTDSARKSGATDGGSHPPLAVKDLGRIGSYEVQVIKPNVAGPLDRWLIDHDFELTPRLREALNGYTREGWSFVTARFAHQDETASPHPLRLDFKTDQAIYPMRLTAASTDSLELDLIVLGEQTAHVQPLVLQSSRWADFRHPYLSELIGTLKPTTYVTHLRKKLHNFEMAQDYTISWSKTKNIPLEVTGSTQMVNRLLLYGVPLLGLAFILTACGYGAGLWNSSMLTRANLFLTLLASALTFGIYISSVAPEQTGKIRPFVYYREWAALPEVLGGRLKRPFRESLVNAKGYWAERGIKLSDYYGDVPGGFNLESGSLGDELVIYNNSGVPKIKYPIGADGTFGEMIELP